MRSQYIHKTIYVTKEQDKWLTKKGNRGQASVLIRKLLEAAMRKNHD